VSPSGVPSCLSTPTNASMISGASNARLRRPICYNLDMMTDRGPSLEDRIACLERLLEEGRVSAQKWELDSPSTKALKRARQLLSSFAQRFEDVSAFDVTVAVDGAIEITALLGELFLTVDVSQSGHTVQAIIDRPVSGEVTWSSRNASADEIMTEIERAA